MSVPRLCELINWDEARNLFSKLRRFFTYSKVIVHAFSLLYVVIYILLSMFLEFPLHWLCRGLFYFIPGEWIQDPSLDEYLFKIFIHLWEAFSAMLNREALDSFKAKMIRHVSSM